MSQPIRGQGGHLVFPIGQKNKKLGIGRWDLASCQVKMNSVQRFQRRGRKCLSQSEASGAILFFPIDPKHKLGRGSWDLASWQVSLNSVQRFQMRSRKCLSQSEVRTAILFFPIGPKNTNLVEDVRSCFLSSFVEFRSADSEEKSNMSQPIRGHGGHLVFPIDPKNTNLVEDVSILLPVKFLWIPFSGFRGEVENVSANQSPGRPSCFSDWSLKHKLGRGRWDLASY